MPTQAPFMAKRVCKVLRYVLCNFYSDHCLFGFASSGLQSAKMILAESSGFYENIAVRNAYKRFKIATKAPFMAKSACKLLRCVLCNFCPYRCSSVLPLATCRMRKRPILAKNSGFYENIAVRNG